VWKRRLRQRLRGDDFSLNFAFDRNRTFVDSISFDQFIRYQTVGRDIGVLSFFETTGLNQN
jgi:hypothetical protein